MLTGLALVVTGVASAWGTTAPVARPVVDASSIKRKAATANPVPLTRDAHQLLEWVVRSRDHGARPFLILDKRAAAVWMFDTQGILAGSSPVLLGAARGDHTISGIGERPMALVKPSERTTPAGRFTLEPGKNLQGEGILWIDYDAAVSMHRLRALDPRERRWQRIASTDTDDNRISYGCVNVPPNTFDTIVLPLLGRGGTAYVMPESHALTSIFPITPAPDGFAFRR